MIEFKKATEADFSDIAHIYNESFYQASSLLPIESINHVITPHDVAGWLLNQNGRENSIWILKEGEKCIAFAHTLLTDEIGDQPVPTLYFIPYDQHLGESRIAVMRNHQNKGMGRMLIDEILDFYDGRAKIALVMVYNTNQKGVQALQRHQFLHEDIAFYKPYSLERPFAVSTVIATIDLQNACPCQGNESDSSIGIRRAISEYTEAVMNINRTNVTWAPQTHEYDWCRRYIDGHFGHAVYVAEKNGEVLGVIDYLPNGRIGIPGVREQYRRQGIGTTLLTHILSLMRDNGFKTAFADSGMTQLDAIRLYGQVGMKTDWHRQVWMKEL